MKYYNFTSSLQLSEKDYIIDIIPTNLNSLQNDLLVSSSDLKLRLIPSNFTSSSSPIWTVAGADQSQITSIKSFDLSTFISSGYDGIKVWDSRVKPNASRPVHQFNLPILPAPGNKGNSKAPIVTAIDVCPQNNQIAAGTELTGTDASLFIWDIRNSSKPAISYIDSHSDDVTCLRYHPVNKQVLLSGSTDGLINIYNTQIADEEEALYQTINNQISIHSAGFISQQEVFALSHTETLTMYQIPNPDDEKVTEREVKPLEFGDVREKWACEYVVDFYPGFIATGRNSVDPQLQLIPFTPATYDSARDSSSLALDNSLILKGAHGEEVVRSLYYDQKCSNIYTCGEDGCIKSWHIDQGDLDVTQSYFQNVPWELEYLNSKTIEASTDNDVEIKDAVKGKHTDKVKRHGHKKDKVSKKHKKHERFNPY